MSAPTTTNPVSSSPKRSWRRFTLRALFLVVLAAAVFFGWVAYRVRQFHEQAAFIADLRSRGFDIQTTPAPNENFWRLLVGDNAMQVKSAMLCADLPNNRLLGPTSNDFELMAAWAGIEWLQVYGPNVSDESLAVVRSFPHLKHLMIYQTAISDAGLRHLDRLNELTSLDIGDHMPNHDRAYGILTCDCVEHIVRLKNLRRLRIYNVQLTANALKLIAVNLPHLESLWLDKCNITDIGVAHLTKLSKLSQLYLLNNPCITDASLQHLYSLSSLTSVDLSHTSISSESARLFQSKRPSVHVMYL